jgi:hypothetical protein
MKYSEFPYKRVSVESKKEEMSQWLERFNSAESVSEQISVLILSNHWLISSFLDSTDTLL